MILLVFNPCGGPEGRTEESLRALGDERAEERAIVRVYTLGPAALATSSQALSVFFAVWRRGGGPRYIIGFIIKLGYISIDLIKVEAIVSWQELENII